MTNTFLNANNIIFCDWLPGTSGRPSYLDCLGSTYYLRKLCKRLHLEKHIFRFSVNLDFNNVRIE